MVTKAQETAQANFYGELKKLQSDFQRDWAENSVPDLWNDVPALHPFQPKRKKVTLTLDEDMVAWFRKSGRGFHARINSILRIYWHALVSGQIKAHWDAQALGPNEHSYVESLLMKQLEQVRDDVEEGADNEALVQAEAELAEGLAMFRQLTRGVDE